MSNSLQPHDCSPSDYSVHGILQARILEWVAIPFSRDSPGIFPTQESRRGLLHCRQILYLSHQGSPYIIENIYTNWISNKAWTKWTCSYFDCRYVRYLACLVLRSPLGPITCEYHSSSDSANAMVSPCSQLFQNSCSLSTPTHGDEQYL